jgi:hypothetical protein
VQESLPFDKQIKKILKKQSEKLKQDTKSTLMKTDHNIEEHELK